MTKKNRNPKSDENKLEAIEKEAETFNPLFGIGCVTLRGKGGSFAEAGRLKREAQQALERIAEMIEEGLTDAKQ